jgi:hypothetical protein
MSWLYNSIASLFRQEEPDKSHKRVIEKWEAAKVIQQEQYT